MKKMRLQTIAAAAVLALTVCGAAQAPLLSTPLAVSAASSISGSVSHNFTTQGLQSDWFTITGNLATGKGTAEYNGQTLTQCLKMESATEIAFSTNGNATVTLVILSGESVYIDSTKYTLDGSGKLTAQVGAGAHTIKKGSGSSFLFYIDVQGDGSAPAVTDPQPTDPQPSDPQPTDPQPENPGSQGETVISGDFKVVSSGGWNEMLYATLSGIKDADVKSVSYSGAASGSLQGDDLTYLVRDTSAGVRIDIPGVPAGTYTLTVGTSKGTAAISGIKVSAQDRSGYAHFNYKQGVGAYNDDGTLKANAIVLYVTNDNKNTVTVKSKDGTSVSGIGNILNSSGKDSGGGKTSKGGTSNSNKGIIEKIAKDGTPLVVRIIGDVTAPDGLTAYDSVDYGGSVGDNGFMARMQSGKDVTIEGIGTDATVNGWGFHFICESGNPTLGKSFEVRNLKFRNVPEDCIGMEGVQEGSSLTASVEHCWIHNNEFYKPTIKNPAESDKAGGDGACDFKRGMYFTNSYNYYEGYHKTNLVGASDSNLQFHITFHHNYWKSCESRGPLARQANIHMYNNIFEGQTSYCQNPRADAYIFSEYNLFENSKNPQQIKQGAIKSYNDTLTGCKGDMQATVVKDKSQKVSSNNKYGDFDTNASLSYIPSNSYQLLTDTSKLKSYFASNGGTLDDQSLSGSASSGQPADPVPAETTTVTTTVPVIETTTETTVPQTPQPDESDLRGDADCSGNVDVSDCVLIARVVSEDDTAVISAQGKRNADVNGSGAPDMDDSTLILQWVAKLIDKL